MAGGDNRAVEEGLAQPRILYVGGEDISAPRGPSVNEREFILEAMKHLGSSLHCVIPRPSDAADARQLGDQATFVSRPHGRSLRRISMQAALFRGARRQLRAGDFDLLVFRLMFMPLAQYLLAKEGSAPHAIKTLGVGTISGYRREGGAVRRFVGIPHDVLVRQLVRSAVVVDVVTDALAAVLAKSFDVPSSRLEVIDNAANTDVFRPLPRDAARRQCGMEEFDPIVGYVGAHADVRGGRQLLDIAERLQGDFPRLGVAIVGGGRAVEHLRAEARHRGLGEACITPGLVPYAEVPAYVNCLDLAVSFAPHDRMYRLGHSQQKVRQYLACGVPVLSGPGGNDFLEAVGVGSLVDADSPGELAEAARSWLVTMATDGDEVRARARRYAETHLSMKMAVRRRLDVWAERLDRSGV